LLLALWPAAGASGKSLTDAIVALFSAVRAIVARAARLAVVADPPARSAGWVRRKNEQNATLGN
jgi:hypothetical protein